MRELILALERTLKLLESSADSAWANFTVDEAREILQTELENYHKTQELSSSGKSQIQFLFLPTSALQEISMDNGWGDEYLDIANLIDKYL